MAAAARQALWGAAQAAALQRSMTDHALAFGFARGFLVAAARARREDLARGEAERGVRRPSPGNT